MQQLDKDQYRQNQKTDSVTALKLVHSGGEYFDMLSHLIKSAKRSIYLLVYIFIEDETGRAITDLLITAAKRAVDVKVLVDAFGSNRLSKHFIHNLRNNGIQIRRFSPYLTGDIYSIGRRMHVKAVVVDEQQAMIGGINISNHYNDNMAEAWLDYAVLLTDENIGKELAEFCKNLIEKKMSRRMLEKYRLGNADFEILINDWFLQKRSIYRSFNELLESSKKEITIMVSYFLPGRKFKKLLADAAKRGVAVHLINSGQIDIPFMRSAIRYLYPWLQRHNIKLYEWQPSVLHAKVMVVDGKVCTIGSYNLNSLSQYNSLEMNVNIREPNLVKQLYDELEEIKTNSSKSIRIERYETNMLNQFINWISYNLIRLALKVMLLFKKERKLENI